MKVYISYTDSDTDTPPVISGIFYAEIYLSDDWSNINMINIRNIQNTITTNTSGLYFYIAQIDNILDNLILTFSNFTSTTPIVIKQCQELDITNLFGITFFGVANGGFSNLYGCNECDDTYRTLTNIFTFPNLYNLIISQYTKDSPLICNLYYETYINKLILEQPISTLVTGFFSTVKVKVYGSNNKIYLVSDVNLSILNGILSYPNLFFLNTTCNILS